LPFILEDKAAEEQPPVTRSIIPQSLWAVYREVAGVAAELKRQGKTLAEIVAELNRLGYRTRTGKPWRHATQVCRLLRSFGDNS
jgi:hypothetical protein